MLFHMATLNYFKDYHWMLVHILVSHHLTTIQHRIWMG